MLRGFAKAVVNFAADIRDGWKRTGTKRKNSGRVPVQNPRNIYSTYTVEFANLNPEKLKYYFEACRKGLNFWKALLFEYIRDIDLHIKSVCTRRRIGLIGKHKLSKLDNYIEGGDEKLRQFIIDNLEGINFPMFVCDTVEASIEGMSLFEINYELKGTEIHLDSVERIPNWLSVYSDIDKKYYFIDVTKTDVFKLRAVTSSTADDRIDLNRISVLELPEEKLLEAHSLEGNNANGMRNGVISAVSNGFLFKSYNIKDLAMFLETMVVPPIVAKESALMNDEESKQLEEAIFNFGNFMRLIVPEGVEVDVLTDATKGIASDIFHKIIDYWDVKTSICLLGENLTTQLTGSTGSRAASETHKSVSEELMLSDMLIVELAVNTLIKKLVNMNKANVKEYPVFSFPETKSLGDKKLVAEIIEILKGAGYKPKVEDVNKEMDMELEEIEAPAPIAEEPPPAPPANEEKPKPAASKEDVKKLFSHLTKLANAKEIEDDLNNLLEDIFNKAA